MARRKEGHDVLFVEVPEELKERLRALAGRNHRSMNGEVVVAIEQHVAAAQGEEPTDKANKGGGN